MARGRANTIEDFWRQVEEHPSGCWLWTGHTDLAGYGRLKFGGRDWLAHRLAYEATLGPIPVDHDLDHRCEVKNCVSPLHLTPLTSAEHMRLSHERRGPSKECRSGHPRTPENTYHRPSGGIECRECKRKWEAEKRERLRG